jgi:hypothetical protein
MDVDAFSLLQSHKKLFYDNFRNEHIKTKTIDGCGDVERNLYNYFKDKIQDVKVPCVQWINDLM